MFWRDTWYSTSSTPFSHTITEGMLCSSPKHLGSGTWLSRALGSRAMAVAAIKSAVPSSHPSTYSRRMRGKEKTTRLRLLGDVER